MGGGLSVKRNGSPTITRHCRNVATRSTTQMTNEHSIERSLENSGFTWTQLPHYLQQFMIHNHVKTQLKDTNLDAQEMSKLRELVQQEFVPSEYCYICSVYSPQETRQCNMCLQSFHEGCLVFMGQLSTESEIKRFKNAEADHEGWFCCQCENMAQILKKYGAKEVLDFLESIRLDEETLESMRTTMESRQCSTSQSTKKRLSSGRSSCLDPLEGNEKLHWWEFLRFEAVKRLSLSSIKLLTPSRRKRINCMAEDVNLNNSISSCDSLAEIVTSQVFHPCKTLSNTTSFSPVLDLQQENNCGSYQDRFHAFPTTVHYSGREHHYHNDDETHFKFPGTASDSPIHHRKSQCS